MNGDDSLVTEPPVTTASGGIFSDFFSAAQAKLGDLTARYTTLPTNPQQSVGGSIFEAIYQYGKGRADLARERAATALLQSRTGQRFVAEVEMQRLKQYIPAIIVGVLVILIAAFLMRR